MRRHKNSVGYDNRGLSLIEVIVSLLILMIIVVPILSGFIASTKANRSAKDSIYAGTAADNIMENVKALGIRGTAYEFAVSDGAFRIAPECTSHYESGVYRSILHNDAEDKNEYVQLPNPSPGASDSPSYVYRADNIQEGTNVFDAEVIISLADEHSGKKENGTDKINSYQFGNLEAFKSDSIAVINPTLVGSSYDDKAISFFASMNKRVVDADYSDICKDIDRENRIAYAQWETEHAADILAGLAPPTPVPKAYPPRTVEPKTLAQVKECVSKKLVVKVEKVSSPGGDKRWRVNSELVYSCKNEGGAFSKNITEYPEDGSVTIEKIYKGFFVNRYYNKLNTIMIMYSPLHDLTNLNRENIELDKQSEDPLNVYAVMLGKDNDYKNAVGVPKFKVHDTANGGASSNIELYSQLALSVDSSSTPILPEQQHVGLVSDLSAGSRLYNITVNIYEAEGEYAPDKLVTHLDSTYLDE